MAPLRGALTRNRARQKLPSRTTALSILPTTCTAKSDLCWKFSEGLSGSLQPEREPPLPCS